MPHNEFVPIAIIADFRNQLDFFRKPKAFFIDCSVIFADGVKLSKLPTFIVIVQLLFFDFSSVIRADFEIRHCLKSSLS